VHPRRQQHTASKTSNQSTKWYQMMSFDEWHHLMISTNQVTKSYQVVSHKLIYRHIPMQHTATLTDLPPIPIKKQSAMQCSAGIYTQQHTHILAATQRYLMAHISILWPISLSYGPYLLQYTHIFEMGPMRDTHCNISTDATCWHMQHVDRCRMLTHATC